MALAETTRPGPRSLGRSGSVRGRVGRPPGRLVSTTTGSFWQRGIGATSKIATATGRWMRSARTSLPARCPSRWQWRISITTSTSGRLCERRMPWARAACTSWGASGGTVAARWSPTATCRWITAPRWPNLLSIVSARAWHSSASTTSRGLSRSRARCCLSAPALCSDRRPPD